MIHPCIIKSSFACQIGFFSYGVEFQELFLGPIEYHANFPRLHFLLLYFLFLIAFVYWVFGWWLCWADFVFVGGVVFVVLAVALLDRLDRIFQIWIHVVIVIL